MTPPSPPDKELVLCFPRSILLSYQPGPPLLYDFHLWQEILSSLRPIPRFLAETDYQMKQLVVYILISSSGRFLTYRRTHKTREDRLRARYSIGIGGHVNLQDHQLPLWATKDPPQEQLILQAVWREIAEEIDLRSPLQSEPRLLTFINDESDDVGRVHFGVVWHLELSEPNVEGKRERGVGELQFLDLRAIEALRANMESWSVILLDILPEVANGSPHGHLFAQDRHR